MGPAEPERLLAGRYQLHTIIGRGGMGVVWRARDQLLGRDVAVKEIVWPPHLDTEERDIARRRALREAQMAARLSHPNVVGIYDIVEEDGRPWLVMELVPYRSLRDVIVADGPLPSARAAQVGLGILAALRAAHHAGVLHRDVKPANVLLAPEGRVVLTDFGIARAADSPALTSSGVLVGSPSYISPERARGEGATAAGDMWALGACLYAAVEGRPPFERDGALASLTAVVTDEPDPPSHAGRLWPVISGLLRKEPAERLGADAVEEMLHRVSEGETPPAGRERPAEPAAPAAAPLAGLPLAGLPLAGPPLAELPLADPAAEPESPAGAEPQAVPGPPAGAEPAAGPGAPAGAEPGTAPVSPAGTGQPTGPVPSAAADDPTGPVPAVAATSVPQDPGPPAPVDLSPGSPPPGNSPPDSGQPDSAQPDSAQPDSAQPDSAQPDSAQPDSAQPAEPGPGAHRRRVAVLAAAAAATVAVVVGAVVAVVLAAPGSPQHPSAHTATSTPRASATRSVPASSPASPSSPATPPGGTSAWPAGYQRFTNSTGFSIGVPTGWQISHDGHYVYIRDPANSGIFLLIDQSNQPQPNALADWQQQAASRQNSYPGYHLIRLQAVPYAQAEQAADWEFTYNRGGIEVRILNRNILANADHAYALYWSVPETEWSADYHYFQAFAATFQPAGVNQG